MTDAHPSSNSRGGFTIVELLVVISIVGLLLTILLPSLSSARYLANKTLSMSNMKQTNMLILYYAADNHEYVPNTVRQDQGCSFWTNFYIIVYPTNLVRNTVGVTLGPYTTNPNIFMAPNHLQHLTSTYKAVDPNYFNAYYGYWYNQPAQAAPYTYGYAMSSYSYLPWLGFLAYPDGPTMRTDGKVSGYTGTGVYATTQYNNMCILNETVATPNSDNTPDLQYKSVNMVNNIADGGNVLYGDGSCKWAPRSAYVGGMTDSIQNGGYSTFNYDVIFRY
jgi:prepilin-type N-terminal cleavage/methylation domain-containing protein